MASQVVQDSYVQVNDLSPRCQSSRYSQWRSRKVENSSAHLKETPTLSQINSIVDSIDHTGQSSVHLSALDSYCNLRQPGLLDIGRVLGPERLPFLAG